MKLTIINPTFGDLLRALEKHPNSPARHPLPPLDKADVSRPDEQRPVMRREGKGGAKLDRSGFSFLNEFDQSEQHVKRAFLMKDERRLLVMEIQMSEQELIIRLEEQL